MSDICNRLRKAADANRNASWSEELDGCEELMDEAADEIERLQAENDDLLFSLRVQIGFAVARTDAERAAVSRAHQKARGA